MWTCAPCVCFSENEKEKNEREEGKKGERKEQGEKGNVFHDVI